MDNLGLASYCQDMLRKKTLYAWGGIMRVASDSYIKQLVSMYPKQYSDFRIQYLKGQVGKAYLCDCVGLVKSFLWGGVGSPNYNPDTDINTSGFYSTATDKGAISTMPQVTGLLTYMDGHIGVYAGDGKVIECTYGGYGDGVVMTDLAGRGWTHWLMCGFIDYIIPREYKFCVCRKDEDGCR